MATGLGPGSGSTTGQGGFDSCRGLHDMALGKSMELAFAINFKDFWWERIATAHRVSLAMTEKA